MELNSRCTKLLNELLAVDGPVQSGGLPSLLKVNKRALQYDIGKTNKLLAAKQLGKIETREKLLLLVSTQRQRAKIGELLATQNRMPFTAEQRRAMELIMVAVGPGPITVEAMQREFDVSKNTILGDIRDLKFGMQEGLTLHSTIKQGYSLLGDEFAIRRLLSAKVQLLNNTYFGSSLKNFLNNSLAAITGSEGNDYYSITQEGIRDYQNELDTCLVSGDSGHEIAMSLISAGRSMQGLSCKMDIREKNFLKHFPQHKAIRHVTKHLEGASITLGEDESYYFTILFLSIRNYDFTEAMEGPDFLRQFTIRLVNCFERAACVIFSDKEQLIARLFHHIHPMYFRLKYGVHASDNLTSEAKARYSWVYRYTKKALEMAGSDVTDLISDEEVAYLCVYMGSYLSRWDHKYQQDKRKILIVCGAGVATSVLLRQQMEELLGDAFYYVLVPSTRVFQENLEAYYMIVSTVQLESEATYVVRTGPILSTETQAQIIDYAASLDDFYFVREEVRQDIEVFKKYAAVENEDQLRRELFSVTVKRGTPVSQRHMPQLVELLNKENYIRFSWVESGRRAITDICSTLNTTTARRKRAVEEMFHHIDGGGEKPEIFWLANGIVLEYYKGDTVGAHILLMPNSPQLFDATPVHVVIALSAVDNTSHLPLLDDLYDLFTAPDIYPTLKLIPPGNVATATAILMKKLDWND